MKYEIGRFVEVKRTFTQEDFNRFGTLSKDDNPVHVDPEFARNTHFGATAAHGMFLYSNLSGIMNDQFPGMVQIEQELMFTNPTLVGEEVTFRIEITNTQPDGTVELKTDGTKNGDKSVLTGTARIKP